MTRTFTNRRPDGGTDKRSMRNRHLPVLVMALSLVACASRHATVPVAVDSPSLAIVAVEYQASLTGL